MTIVVISIVVALTILYLIEMNQQNPIDQLNNGEMDEIKEEDVVVEPKPTLDEVKETVIEKTEETVKTVKKKSPKKPKKKD